MFKYLMTNRKITRRQFLKSLGGALLFLTSARFLEGLSLAKAEGFNGRQKSDIKGLHDLVVSEGENSYLNVVEAVKAMGGMERFVKKGDVVVVKPNMAWDRTPEQAANTDPDVVASVVEMCYKAGAKRVNVFDNPCNDEKRVYESSGISKAAKAKGAYVYFTDSWNVVEAHFPYKSKIENWPVFRDALTCDKFINVPVLKDHGLTRLTLSMKNLMGVCSGNRGNIHVDIGEKLVDLTDFIKPDLTIIDATRVLIKHGPVGGNLADVKQMNKVIVATDPTLADTYASTLVGIEPSSVPYIKEAIARGFGNSDLSKASIKHIKA
ncbi:MAG: DUF362 domain-containing protein [Candidatus Omnitrophica bacterium]|nr:DUF362 domain-containing protein [Candidatus Omnitrophota bacterium]